MKRGENVVVLVDKDLGDNDVVGAKEVTDEESASNDSSSSDDDDDEEKDVIAMFSMLFVVWNVASW